MDLRLPVAHDGIDISTVGFMDLENRGVAVGISILCATELEICLRSVATPPLVLRVSEIGLGLRGLKLTYVHVQFQKFSGGDTPGPSALAIGEEKVNSPIK